MKESIKRTRIEIVANSLGYMIAKKSSLTRKEIFDIDVPYLDKNKIAAASVSKTWQNTVLDRLVSDGILKKDNYPNGIAYALDNRDRAARVYYNFKNEDGTMISHYLFPNEVPYPKEFESGSQKEVFIEDIGVVLKESPPNPVLDNSEENKTISFEDLTLAIHKLLLSVNNVAENQEKLFQQSGTSFNDIGLTHTIQAKLYEANSTTLLQIKEGVAGVKNCVNSLETTVKNQGKVIEANQTTVKELLANSKSILEFSTALKESTAVVANLNSTIKDLVSEIKRKEANTTQNLLSKLNGLLGDVKFVSEEILESTIKEVNNGT